MAAADGGRAAVAAAPLVVVAAGGTGGHLFPAEALTVALAKRGVVVDLATDERATRYGGSFPARATHLIPSATFRGRDPLRGRAHHLGARQGRARWPRPDARIAAGGGDRLRRLSDHPAGVPRRGCAASRP